MKNLLKQKLLLALLEILVSSVILIGCLILLLSGSIFIALALFLAGLFILYRLLVNASYIDFVIKEVETQLYFFKFLGINANFNFVKIPKMKANQSYSLLIIPGWLSTEEIAQICVSKIDCWTKSFNFKGFSTKNCRVTEQLYAVWVNDLTSDPEYKDWIHTKTYLSANLTLKEMLILQLFHCYSKTKRLGFGIVLCNGSINNLGFLPGIHYYDSGLKLDWYNPKNLAEMPAILRIVA